jgi:hypothetical protein
VVWSIYLIASIIVCELFNLFSINTIDVLTYNIKGLLIINVAETLVRLFNNIIDVLIKSGLTER